VDPRPGERGRGREVLLPAAGAVVEVLAEQHRLLADEQQEAQRRAVGLAEVVLVGEVEVERHRLAARDGGRGLEPEVRGDAGGERELAHEFAPRSAGDPRVAVRLTKRGVVPAPTPLVYGGSVGTAPASGALGRIRRRAATGRDRCRCRTRRGGCSAGTYRSRA